MSNQSPTLAEMKSSLTHAVASDSSVSTPKSKGKKKLGGGEFDESKVKRDGSGRFSKQASAKTSTTNPKDQAWLKGLNSARMEKILSQPKHYDRFVKAYDKAFAKYGYTRENIDKAPKKLRPAIAKTLANIANREVMSKVPEFRSPSGNVNVQMVVTPGPKLEYRAIDKTTGKQTRLSPVPTRPNAVDPKMRHSISPTLAEMEESLSHAVAKDFLSPKPKSDKKGKRAFDESMVKRDGSGQFAKQASAKKAGVDPKDAAWLKNLTDERINNIMARDKNYKRLMDTYDRAFKKHGFKSWNALEKAPKATQNAAFKTAITMINRELIPTIKEFKSPTGKAQVEIVMVGKDFDVRIVDKASGTMINPAPIRVRPNAVDPKMRHSISPTLGEMRDILEDDGEALAHFGIKGMKWGIRRSRKELGRLRNEDGEDVGGLRASTRKAANKLRSMKPGETIVIDDGEKGPKIYTKQPDGTFKQTHLAVDTERFMRTMSKDPSEMSTKEIQDATKRAKAVEEYNKMFNPYGDPNYELKLVAEAMKLEAEYRKAYAQVNPPSPSMAKRLGTFINDMQPAYNVFKAADKAVNGKFSESFKNMFNALDGTQANVGSSGSTGNTKKTKSYPFTATKSKTSANRVYDITDLGKDDYLNPFIAELEGRRR